MQSDNDDQTMCNVKAVSFIPLFVQLAIEFNSFRNEERGGLLVEDDNGNTVLHYLVCSPHSSYDDCKEHHELVDTAFVAVLIRLRRSGYLVKEDIQQYDLVYRLCRKQQFSKHRFRRLIEWDPSSLLIAFSVTEQCRCLPLHWVADNLQAFQVVLDCLFRYYPRWRGINTLFTVDDNGHTPFQIACIFLTHTKVMEVVEEILVQYTTNDGLVNTNNNGNAIILAASDDTMSLDGLFFLIRRQPNTMLSMVRHRNNNRATNRSNDSGVDSTASDDNNDTENGCHNEHNHNYTGDSTSNTDHGSNTNHNTVTVLQRSTRKRKRN